VDCRKKKFSWIRGILISCFGTIHKHYNEFTVFMFTEFYWYYSLNQREVPNSQYYILCFCIIYFNYAISELIWSCFCYSTCFLWILGCSIPYNKCSDRNILYWHHYVHMCFWLRTHIWDLDPHLSS